MTPPNKKLLVLAFLVVTVLLVFLVDPRGHNFFPPCVFHQLTGWNCPGCGATRATHDLLHCQLVQAVRDNALFVGALPISIWFIAVSWARRMSPLKISLHWLWILSLLAVAFGVWRNLPVGAWWNP